MKIMFFINTLGGGGAEKLLIDLLTILEDKYDIYIYTLVNKGIYRNKLPKTVHYKSLINSKNRYISLFLQYLYVFIFPPKLVYRMFFKEKFDVEIAFLEGPTTKIISSSTNKNSLKIAWVHYDLYNKFTIRKMYPFMFQHKKCYQRFDNVVCVCNETKDNFIKRFGIHENVIVLNNFVDINRINELASEPIQIRNDKIVFTSIGRLVDDKGFDKLLKIYDKLNNKYPDKFEAYIIGEGNKKQELLSYLNERKLINVHLIDFTLNPYCYLKHSDYLISSSLREGFGLVLVEALALNIPIIATKTAGSLEIIKDDRYGTICNDFDELEEKLSNIIDNNLKKDNVSTYKLAMKYDVHTQLSNLEKLFTGGFHV